MKSVKYNNTEIAPQNGVYSFKMPTEEVTVTAEFELKDYSITIDPDIWGATLTVDKTTAHMGETVTVTVVPNDDPHYYIKTENVKYNGIEIPNNNGYSFIMPAENVEITGRFTANGISGDIIWEYDHDTKTVTFTGNGAIIDYTPEDPSPWSYLKDDITAIKIEQGITKIGTYAFYINENGEEAVIDAYKLSANDTKLDKGAYFVDTDMEIAHSIEFRADTKLILCDGTKLNITLNDNSANALKAVSLAAYGQKEQTGKLQITLNNTDTTAIMVNGIYCDEYKQYGGNVTANVNAEIANSDAVCVTGKGGIEICGGALNADSQKADGISAFNYSVVVSGGNVTADSIYAARNITLSLENAKDSIFAEEYKAKAISIADERILKADNEFFAGKVNKTELSGKTLAKYDYVKGDTDLDGTLEDKDAALLLKYINGTAALSNANLVAAGVQNKEADILDVIAVLKLHQAD